MAVDVVEGEGRGVGAWCLDFAVGEEAGFDECLESVADSKDEAVARVDELVDGVLDARVAEDGGDKFAGAIGFIAGGEAPGKHEDL